MIEEQQPEFIEEDNPYQQQQQKPKMQTNAVFMGIVWFLIIAVLLVYGWKIIQAVLGAI